MESVPVRFYEFDDFRLDVRRRILLKDGEQIALSSRLYDLLLVFLENEGKVLEHDFLLDKVWEGMFVEQSNLKKSVSALRQILGETPNESLFIKTVPRRGYSFVAAVTPVSDEPDEEVVFRQTETEIVVEEYEEEDDEGEIIEVKALPPAPEAKSNTKRLILGIAAIGIAAAAVGYWYFASRPKLFSVENVTVQRLTNDGTYFDSAVSPDGNFIAHASKDDDGTSLNIHQLATGGTSRLVTYADASFWAYTFTPDGNFVYYIVKNWGDPDKTGIYRIPFLGGEPKLIYKSNGGGGITFSPDGKLLVFEHNDENQNPQIVSISPEGADPKILTTFESTTRLWNIRFNPDGKRVLYALRKTQPDDSTTYTIGEVSAADGTRTDIIPDQERVIQSAAWLPDMSSLIFLIREPNAELRQLWQFFPGSNEWRRVTNDNDTYRTLNIVRQGTAIVATKETSVSSIWVGEGEPLDFRQITGGINVYGHANWTADDRLVYLSVENRAEVITVMTAAGRNKKPLSTGTDGIWMQPVVGGDGRTVVFVSNRSGTTQMWRMGIDGENASQLTTSNSPVFNGTMLSDGKTVIFQKYEKPGGWHIYKQVGSEPAVPISDLQISTWDLAPDERSLAIWAEDPDTKKWKLVIMSIDNGSILKTVDIKANETMVRWTHDGNSLAYIETKDDLSEMKLQSVNDSSPAKTIANFRGEPVLWFKWSPDGKRLAIIRGKRVADAVMITRNQPN